MVPKIQVKLRSAKNVWRENAYSSFLDSHWPATPIDRLEFNSWSIICDSTTT